MAMVTASEPRRTRRSLLVAVTLLTLSIGMLTSCQSALSVVLVNRCGPDVEYRKDSLREYVLDKDWFDLGYGQRSGVSGFPEDETHLFVRVRGDSGDEPTEFSLNIADLPTSSDPDIDYEVVLRDGRCPS